MTLSFLQIPHFYMDCVSFEGGLKGKMDGDDCLNPFNLLSRRLNKYVKMTDGVGDRDGRRNSPPWTRPLFYGLSLSFNDYERRTLSHHYLLSTATQFQASVWCVRFVRCGMSFLLPEVWVAPCLLPLI